MISSPTKGKSTTLAQQPLRYWFLLAPGLPFIGVLCLLGYHYFGLWQLCWIGPLLLHGIIPVCDYLIGETTHNVTEAVARQLDADPYYRRIIHLFVPGQYIANAYAVYLAFLYPNATWLDSFAIMWSLGVLNGTGINTAHELCHKLNPVDRWVAKIALAPSCYGHFFVEHPLGHHKRVATPEDPASSRLGETFWEFMPRSVYYGVVSAWDIEKQRLNKQGKSVWSIENHNLNAWAMSVVFYAVVYAYTGIGAVVAMLVQSCYAFSLLEVVNYLEHYGLLRQRKQDGEYEPCEPHHSWNSNCIVSNLFLYQLERHSDHHANPTRMYQALRHFEGCPQLPSGYGSMIPIAYVPWLWFRIMDPRVRAHFGGDLTRANIHPPRRAMYLRS